MRKTDFVSNCLMTMDIKPPLLSGSATYPETLDLRDLVLKTENQGSTSTCAAHAATSWAENVNWRKNGTVVNLDPYKVYDYAKTIDCYEMFLITNRSNISACKCYEKAGGKSDENCV